MCIIFPIIFNKVVKTCMKNVQYCVINDKFLICLKCALFLEEINVFDLT
jgi:hypothetical protein